MEKPDYRDNLEGILAFTHGKHLLNITDVAGYLGVSKPTAIKRCSLDRNGITAESLARSLSRERKS